MHADQSAAGGDGDPGHPRRQRQCGAHLHTLPLRACHLHARYCLQQRKASARPTGTVPLSFPHSPPPPPTPTPCPPPTTHPMCTNSFRDRSGRLTLGFEARAFTLASLASILGVLVTGILPHLEFFCSQEAGNPLSYCSSMRNFACSIFPGKQVCGCCGLLPQCQNSLQ